MSHSKQSLLQFLISHSRLARRKLIDAIASGEVLVNDQIVTSSQHLISPLSDTVFCANEQVIPSKTPQKLLYYKFNKPRNVICSLSDPQKRVDLSAFLKDLPSSLFPVGRLDRLSKGLLLFTNDGDLSYKLTHPKFHVPKTYFIVIDKPMTKDHLSRFKTGFFLSDGPLKADLIERLSPLEYMVSISVGRNRILRRGFDYFGYTVKKLQRISIGPIHLGTLKEGQFSPVSRGELASLKSLLVDELN